MSKRRRDPFDRPRPHVELLPRKRGEPEFPGWFVRSLFFIRIAKSDAEQVQETLNWGADPNWRTKKGTPAIVRAVRVMSPEVALVQTLLKAGADPDAADSLGLTALDHARRRLLRYEGRPRRKPRRSPSLTAGGELNLHKEEWDFIEEIEAAHPGAGDEYLKERRKVAEKVFDPRGNLEKIVEVLEPLAGKR